MLAYFFIALICLSIPLYSIQNRLYTSSSRFFSKHNTYIDAHRGINHEYRENTLPAFNRSIEYKLDGIETDVWIAKDNIPVCVHAGGAGSLNGYYNTTANLMHLNYSEIQNLVSTPGKEKMPSLSDLLDLIKGKIFLQIEIKDPRVDLAFNIISNLLEEKDMIEQVMIISFNHHYYNRIVKYNSQHEKKLVFGFVYFAPKFEQINFKCPGHAMSIYSEVITKKICDTAHENGMAVIAWAGMGQHENDRWFKKLIDKGVDAIACNYGNLAKNFRDKYNLIQKIQEMNDIIDIP